MYARPFIDSLDFALNGQQIDAKVPVAELVRLQDALENTQGVVSFTLKGGKDELGRPVLDMTVAGTCNLRCQRCLSVLEYEISHDGRLLLCNQAELDELEDSEEPFDGILADAHLDVTALIEDEILLSLPISPMHHAGDCQPTESENARKGVRNPFAVLENLKRN